MKIYIAIFCASVLFAACGSDPSQEMDTATTGVITVAVDESFKSIIEQELDVFHATYKYAVVQPIYVPEEEAMKHLVSDSARVAFVTRMPNESEEAYFENLKLRPRVTKLAIDGIALIVHPDNTDSVITIEQIRGLLNGNRTAWKADSVQNPIQIVFDNTNSSTAKYMRDNFSSQFPEYCFAVNTNPEVIDYVANNPNAIGVIGVNWISDSGDTAARDFLEKIDVLYVVGDSTGARGQQPYQAYIAQGTYPLIRYIYAVSREARVGLGTGFVSFVASDKGQRIILKSGLVPATMPVRIISTE